MFYVKQQVLSVSWRSWSLHFEAKNYSRVKKDAKRANLGSIVQYSCCMSLLSQALWAVTESQELIVLAVPDSLSLSLSVFLISIARGAGACLNFSPVVVLILMYRHIATLIRLSFLFPLDKFIKLHKIVGYTIIVLSLVHFLAHLANFSYIEINDSIYSNSSMVQYLFGVGTIGWVYGSAGLTGLLLLIILIIMFICSLPVVRRKGKFEVFYWSHCLYIIWYIVLILHGPHFWKWFVGPAIVFIIEKIFRSKLFHIIHYGGTFIEEVNLLPSKIVSQGGTLVHRRFSFKGREKIQSQDERQPSTHTIRKYGGKYKSFFCDSRFENALKCIQQLKLPYKAGLQYYTSLDVTLMLE
uniref:Ferric oxidoreductase domain-containing protein n=1 Tax=Amphimedon queenslandica TaxID=400682 RepID=A0A1X7TN72_AMPQE